MKNMIEERQQSEHEMLRGSEAPTKVAAKNVLHTENLSHAQDVEDLEQHKRNVQEQIKKVCEEHDKKIKEYCSIKLEMITRAEMRICHEIVELEKRLNKISPWKIWEILTMHSIEKAIKEREGINEHLQSMEEYLFERTRRSEGSISMSNEVFSGKHEPELVRLIGEIKALEREQSNLEVQLTVIDAKEGELMKGKE